MKSKKVARPISSALTGTADLKHNKTKKRGQKNGD